MASNYTTDNNAYLLNGVNLSTWKAYVVSSSGFMSLPKRKMPTAHSWIDDHGEDIDLAAVYFEPTDYSLELIMYADTLALLLTNIKLLFAELSKANLQHLKLAGLPGVFQVYLPEEATVERLTGVNQAQAAARVNLSLRNPTPVTRQFWTSKTAINQTSQLYIVTTKAVTINWGDGAVETIAAGTTTKVHTFAAIGVYCIVVYGGVDGIATLTPTNCTAL